MRIGLLCPDLSSNSLVRAYPIVKVLSRRHRTRIFGFRFGSEIFAPYRHEFDYEATAARGMPAFLGQVREMAQRIDGDALYVFKPLPSSLWVGLLARRRLRVPLLLDIEDWERGWYSGLSVRDAIGHLAHIERSNGLLWTWLSERATGMADEIFVVSRFLQRRFGGTLLIHGADTSEFDPALWDPTEARRLTQLPEDRLIVFTGTAIPQKGIDDLLDAVALLHDRRVRVVIVGSFRHAPGYLEQLRARHGERLVAIGPRAHKEMPLFLAAADAVVLPQRKTPATEAQVPGKVFEAMAMARPVIASAVSDLPEILDGCGLLFEPGSVEQLAASLTWVLDHAHEAREMGAAARRRCVERYSWDAMEQILEATLQRLSR